jgi:hypothetical protein
VRTSEKLSLARASAQRAKEQLDSASLGLAAKSQECEELKLALEEAVRLRKTEIDMRERHSRLVKELQRKLDGAQGGASRDMDLTLRLSALHAITESAEESDAMRKLEEQAAAAAAERDQAVVAAAQAAEATEAAREQVAALTLDLKRSQATTTVVPVGGDTGWGELRVVKAERDELSAEVAMLKQMVKTTSLAVNFKRSHASNETSLRSSRAASPTPSS